MKEFFGKEVIERPRRGSSSPSYKARQYGKIVLTEDGPEYFGATKIKMHMGANPKRTYSDDKGFTDVLGPLKGYLRTSCGRQWDSVFSEISKILGNAGYALGHIITDHLNVATNTWRGESGRVYNDGKSGPDEVGMYDSQFYVEPETGILRSEANYKKWWPVRSVRGKVYPNEPEVQKIPTIAISETAEYTCIKSIWYYTEFVWDKKVWEEKSPYSDRIFTRTEKTKRYTLKRQMGKKELRDEIYHRSRQ